MRSFWCGSDKVVLGCFLAAELKSIATIIANGRDKRKINDNIKKNKLQD